MEELLMKRSRTAIAAAAVAVAIGSAAALARDNSYVDPTTIREVQRTLHRHGFRAGPIDGVMGPSTRAALKGFQQSKKLESTGQLNRQTLVALGVQPDPMSGVERQAAAVGTPAEPTVSAERRVPIFIVAIPSRTVREAQQALNQRGFQAGPPDGFISPATEVALRNFQASANLQATGQLDHQTLDALGIRGSSHAISGS
jgi:peptidoglycan hydrolase-like protein with peptidoglycan-binding domain